MRTRIITAITLVWTSVLLLTSCSAPVTFVEVQSYQATSNRISVAKAFNAITMILVDRGYDIKASNKDAGLITTEYKQFAAIGGSPPFDMLLQIKVTIRERSAGEVSVKLIPIVKEQNRVNAAAYTEHELSYYTGESKNLRFIDSMKEGGWRVKAQTMFMNVVTDVGETLGIPIDDMKQNITETPKNAFGGAN